MVVNLKQVFKRNYESLNKIEINRKNILDNYSYLSSLNSNVRIAPVLKSNAYGHGIKQIAEILDEVNAPFFCVDSLYEGYELLKLKIKTPILIMGTIHPRSLETKKLPFSFAVFNREIIHSLKKYQPEAKIHIFVDTGMDREGIPIDELEKYILYIKKNTSLGIDGLMSHFAMADKPNNPFTKRQIDIFEKAQEIFKRNNITPQWVHISASTGFIHIDSKKTIGNIARVGIATYGIDPSQKMKELKPSLELKTKIGQIKYAKKGDRIGYDFTFTAKQDMKIAIIPIGYNDGVDRRLSSKGIVLIDGRECLIIGRVSMNITTIDVSSIENPTVGQEVIVFSKNPYDNNSISQIAKICDTIPYEILIHLSPQIRRIIV